MYLKTTQGELFNILTFPLCYSHALQLCLLFANQFTNLSKLLHACITKINCFCPSVYSSAQIRLVITNPWLPKLQGTHRLLGPHYNADLDSVGLDGARDFRISNKLMSYYSLAKHILSSKTPANFLKNRNSLDMDKLMS